MTTTRILQISDLHFGPPFVPQVAEALLQTIPDLAPDAIVVSGDTIDCGGIRRLAKDADVLVQCCFANRGECEGNPHLDRVAEFTLADTRQAATIAQECNVRHLVVTHIRPKSRERMAEMRREIRQVFRRKLTVGRDMALVRL